MEKPILIIEGHDELKKLFERADEQEKIIREKIKFIEKQKDDVNKLGESFHNSFWADVENYLERNKLLPEDYAKDTNYIKHSNGVLFTGKKNEDQQGLSSFLKDLFT